MKLSTQVRPISFLKSNAADLIKEIETSRESILITQNGESKAVLMDVTVYEDTQQTLALLKILAMGQKDIEAGNFTPSDEVFAELDRLDKEEGIE